MVFNSFTAADDYNFGAQMTERTSRFLAVLLWVSNQIEKNSIYCFSIYEKQLSLVASRGFEHAILAQMTATIALTSIPLLSVNKFKSVSL